MRVRFWGVRGSIPAPGPYTTKVGGNTPCVQVTGEDGTELILDAGSGIRTLSGADLGDATRIHILLTHLHLDHIQGLLFFAPLFNPEAEVTVWGPPGRGPLRRRLARYLSNPLSPVEIGELPAKVNFEDTPPDAWRVGGLEVRAGLVAHRGPTLGYRLSEGSRTVTYIPDHEPALGTALTSAPGNWISGFTLARGSDVLIHDAQYSEREYAARRGWGHSCLSDTIAFAKRAQPDRLLLFHHDPGHDDDELDAFEKQARGLDGDVRVALAQEGDALEA